MSRLGSGPITFDHVDVLIVGAGISGIGIACHLTTKQPGRTFAIVESRDAIGGTWAGFALPATTEVRSMNAAGDIAYVVWTAAGMLPALFSRTTGAQYRHKESMSRYRQTSGPPTPRGSAPCQKLRK